MKTSKLYTIKADKKTHYYPFGLTMKAISSQAAGTLENKFKYNANELQHGEFSDGSGLETYDANFRQRDSQLGRWWQLDPIMEAHPNLSPYVLTNNNPISFSDPLGLDTVKVFGEGAHKIKIKIGDVLSMTIKNTTTYYIYDPENKNAVDGFVGTGVEEDDSKSTGSTVTVVSEKKAKNNNIDYSSMFSASGGFGSAYGESKMFSNSANSWFSLRQWKTYGQNFHGNQYTGGMNSAKNISRGFKWLGYGIGLYQETGILINGNLSNKDKIVESASNLYSTFGGINGAAWGIGWELGRITTQTDWYNNNVRPSLQNTYRMMGIKIDGDPDMTRINQIPNK